MSTAERARQEPEQRPDEHTTLLVPVRIAGTTRVLRLFRQRDGSRCAVAFSSLDALHGLLGADQPAVELTEPALRGLAEPLGVHSLVLDPRLVAPQAPVAAAPPSPAPVAAPTAAPASAQAVPVLEHQC